MRKIKVLLSFYASTLIHCLIMIICFIDFNLVSLVYFLGALMLMAGKMRVNLNEHVSNKQTLISAYYTIIPFVLIFKTIACVFIWIGTPKTAEEDLITSPSSIVVSADDPYSVFRFVSRVSGVVCAYVWNSNNFIMTFIMEGLIFLCLQILSLF